MRPIIRVITLILVLLGGMLAPVDATLAAPSSPYAVVLAPNLNVRAAPDTSAQVVGVVKVDDRLTLLGRNGDGSWLRIDAATGASGWVFAELVQPSVPVTALNVVTESVTAVASPDSDAKAGIQAALTAKLHESTNQQAVNQAQPIASSVAVPASAANFMPAANGDPSPVAPALPLPEGATPAVSVESTDVPLEPLCLPNRLRAVSLGGRPQTVTAIGDRLYIALTEVNTLMVVDTGMDMMLGTSRTTARQIGSVTAGGDLLYVGDTEANRLIVTTRQGAVTGEIALPAKPGAMAVTDGRAFILHPQIGAVSVVDLNTKEIIATLTIGPDPQQIAVISGRAFIAHAAGFLSVVDAYGHRQEQLHLPINQAVAMAANTTAGILYISSAADQKVVAVDVSTWTLANVWTLDIMPSSLAYNEVTDHLFVLDTTSQFLTILSGLQPQRIGRLQVSSRPALDTGTGIVLLQGKIYVAHPSNDFLDVWLDRTCSNEVANRTPEVVAASYNRTDLAPRQVEARLGILWPHGGAAPEQATFANITATLLREDGASPACSWEPTVTLWAAIGDEPAKQVAVAGRRLMTEGAVTFPVYDFNDVDVRASRELGVPIHFSVRVDGVETAQNVWTHASTGQYMPTVRPELEGIVARHDGALDARIWVEKTPQGPQIYAMLLRAGSHLGIAQTGSSPIPQLRWALDNGVTEPELVVGQAETRQEDGFVFTVWRFPGLDPDDLIRSAAQVRLWIETPEGIVNSSVLAWGKDIRTLRARLPIPVVGCQQEVASR